MSINPPRTRDLGLILAVSNLTLLGVSAGVPRVSVLPVVVSAVLAIIGLAMVVASWLMADPPKVDIWQMQRKLMQMSEQHCPYLPEVNEHTLLYYALMLEETAETADVLYRVLSRSFTQHQGETSMREFALVNTVMKLNELSTHLTKESNALRKNAKRLTNLHIEISRQEAKDLLDGTTDMAVVVAGLGLASGLPNAAGYAEVVSSNYTKANPTTGKIEKDPTGKWIKGTAYLSPDLTLVLEHQHQAYFRSFGSDTDELAARMADATEVELDRRYYGKMPKQEG